MKLLSFPSKEERAALRNSPLDGIVHRSLSTERFPLLHEVVL